MKQSTRMIYKRRFDNEEVGKGGSSCTDVNGIEMGMGYFSSSLSTSTTTTSSTLSPSDLRQRGKKNRSRTEVVVEVPQDELSTPNEEEEEISQDSTATSTEEVPQDDSATEKVPQDSLTLCNRRRRSRPQEGSAILVHVTTPTHKMNNNGLMNENAKYLIAKSQLYQAFLQALNQNQD